MQSFVFDYYGYNVNDIQNGQFDYDGYRFNLLMTTESEENIKIMNELIELLRKPFNERDVKKILEKTINKNTL